MVLKPSEISQSTEKVLAEVLPLYLDQVRVAVPISIPPLPGWPGFPWVGSVP